MVERRASARLKNIPEDKKPYYRDAPRRSSESPEDNVSKKRVKIKHQLVEKRPKEGEARKEVETPKRALERDVNSTNSGEKRVMEVEDGDSKWLGSNHSLLNDCGKSAFLRVKETLRLFNTHYLHCIQEEEKRCKKADVNDRQNNNSKTNDRQNLHAHSQEEEKRCKKEDANGRRKNNSETNKKNASKDDGKRSSKRPDLKAISEMRKKHLILYPIRNFGNLPGVNVGHQFFSRAEMVAVGFHNHWLNGIDYLGGDYAKKVGIKGYTFPLAVAIVLSGQYEDDLDKSEEIVYTGSGGNDLLGNKRQIMDQAMKGGNLALKNNMEQSVPVRVIRGHSCANSYTKKVYTYDGLYKITENWAEKGVAGFTVYKYRLRRLQGQPELATDQVQFTRGRGSKVLADLPGLVWKDICDGQENICIPATNEIDDPPIAPAGFKYTKSIQVAQGVHIPPNVPGCNCKGSCTNPNTCSCAQLNGSNFPYVRQDGGRLIEASAVVFECGPGCGCGPSCVNRISQRGLKYRLEVFCTQNKGWAVRSWDYIPSGAPVCEYTGILRKSDELDNISENDYIFDIDCRQTMEGIGSRERRMRDVTLPTTNVEEKTNGGCDSGPEYCIDAGSTGNVARFINHSCEPNLFVQCVLSSHHDIRLARVILIAADNIPPLQELNYDYGYELDSVAGSDGKVKQLACHCGAAGCRKRLY